MANVNTCSTQDFVTFQKVINNRDIHYIRMNKDIMDWDMISRYFIFTVDELREFKDYILWHIFFEDKKVTQYSFKQLEEFKYIGWVDIFRHKWFFQEDIIEKYPEMFNWRMISEKMDCSISFLRKYQCRLDWLDVSITTHITKEMIDEFGNKLNWGLMSKYQKLPEEIIEKHKDKVDWAYVSHFQNLTEDFIYKHRRDVYWYYIFEKYNLSDEFYEKMFKSKDKRFKEEWAKYINGKSGEINL